MKRSSLKGLFGFDSKYWIILTCLSAYNWYVTDKPLRLKINFVKDHLWHAHTSTSNDKCSHKILLFLRTALSKLQYIRGKLEQWQHYCNILFK